MYHTAAYEYGIATKHLWRCLFTSVGGQKQKREGGTQNEKGEMSLCNVAFTCLFLCCCLSVILLVCLLKCRSLSQGACSFHLGLISIYLAWHTPHTCYHSRRNLSNRRWDCTYSMWITFPKELMGSSLHNLGMSKF